MQQHPMKTRNARKSAICDVVARNAIERAAVISLVASENVMSPAALYACGSDLNHRYTIPAADERHPSIWDYPNQDDVRLVERKTERLAMKLFKADYANVQPLSGNNAVFSVIAAMTKPGDRVMRVPADCGGHFATAPIAAALQLELIDIPYDRRRGVVDVGKLADVFHRQSPALVLFDASMVLFAPPIREIRTATGKKAVISFDGSHTLGIIAGGQFANPLADGADLLHGSTHKSLFGPQKGMIMCRKNNHIAGRIARTVVPLFASNIHSHHVAALGVALEELNLYGHQYAAQVVKNARTLAEYLDSNGIEVYGRERNYTQCHQIWMVVATRDEAMASFRKLEEIGIFANPIRVPFIGKYGLRIGMAEVTRLGMKPADIRALGEIITARLRGKTGANRLRQRTKELAQAFRTVHFALPSPR